MNRETRLLRREIDELRRRNESMQAGMRRCLTCRYRVSSRDGEQRASIDL